ncbi:hypothetical protein LTS17_004073 [Exophiala oligosperma]
MPFKKIDVHHHLVTPAYKTVGDRVLTLSYALEQNGGDPSGSWTPEGSISADEKSCEESGVGVTIFSLTAPGAGIAQGQSDRAAAALARETNEYLASLRDESPRTRGFFACVLPPLTDTPAALEGIAHALDVLKADGVTLFSRYGAPGSPNKYLGHADFGSAWQALNERRAVVFVHPTHAADTDLIDPSLPQPIVDYPHETTRTASGMIVAGTVDAHPDCKIILAHAGGTLPYLADRLLALADTGLASKTARDIKNAVRSSYHDVALSSSKKVVDVLLKVTTPDHILFSTDYPYAPPATIRSFPSRFNDAELKEDFKYAISRGNALKLFPRLAAYEEGKMEKT